MTSTFISGRKTIVVAILKHICAFAICLDITFSSSPLGDIIITKSAIYGVNHINISVPTTLNIVCDIAVLLAFTVPPIDASSAVVVEPILVPNSIGIAPARPMILVTPSGPAVAARF